MVKDLETQRWLGYELHDGLLQWIVGARMQLEVAVAGTADLMQRKKLKQALRYVELAIEEGRGLIGLIEEQTAATPHDFVAMMRKFMRAIAPLAAERLQEIELREPTHAWPELPQALLWNLLRIGQQAVRNAIEHAGPAKISIVMERLDGQQLRLEVSDDGVGFDPDRPKRLPSTSAHFGVASMLHRASLIGGELKITTSPGRGCSVVLTVTPPQDDSSE